MDRQTILKNVQILFFPLLILYDELMLRVLAGTIRLDGFGYIFFFSLSFGFFLFAVVSFVHGKAARILTDILLWCVTILFSVESVVRSVFTTYMTPQNLAFASGNASANYTSEVVRAILGGIPKFLLFAAPVFLYLFLTGNKRPGAHGLHPETSPEKEKGKKGQKAEVSDASHSAMAPKKKQGKKGRKAHASQSDEALRKPQTQNSLSLRTSVLILACSLILGWATSLSAANGSHKALYGAQFDYNRATETFGLVTSTRLACRYSLFGNSNTTYSTVSLESADGASKSAGDTLSRGSSESAGGTLSTESVKSTGNTLSGSVKSDTVTSVDSSSEPESQSSTSAEENPWVPDSEPAVISTESEADSAANSSADESGTASSSESANEKGSEDNSAGTANQESSPISSSDTSSSEGSPNSSGEAAAASTPEPSAAPTPTPVPQTMDIDFSSVTDTGNSEIDSLTSYVESRTPTKTNAYTGIFKGKNLILICAESYCSDFISQELTPTLWRLTTGGIYCTEYYQPEWGGSTTTGEASFLLGLAPKDGDQTMNATADNNNYFTMGNQLQRLGYSSCGFHNGSVYYYNRNLTHTNLGYNQFIANENGLGTLCGHNYPKDTELFDKTLDLYLDKQPFSIYYMTGSGHAPYEADSYCVKTYYDQVNKVVGDSYAEKTKYYICYQMELENALTLMISRLEEAGIADNTVIAMVGDHYPYGLGTGEAWGNDQDYINDLIKGDSTVPFEEDRSGLIIWSESLEEGGDLADKACTIDTPVFSLDVLPTLSNLFGLTYDSRLLPGRDIFSDAEPLVFWNNLSWVTTHGKYDARHNIYYPRDGYTDDADYRAAIDAEVQNRILMSRSIVSTDYYGKLFGADTVTWAGETIFPQ